MELNENEKHHTNITCSASDKLQKDEKNNIKIPTMKDEEHQIQKACITWFRYAYPKYKSLLFAIPNGGKRHIGVAKKMKAEGVVPGVPDLFLAVPSRGFHGLFLEMKSESGRLNDNQKKMIPRLEDQNYMVKVCNSTEKFIKAIEKYFEYEN